MSNIAATLFDILRSVSHVGDMLAASLDVRAQQLRAAVRVEVRRIAASLALSLLAGACAFAALLFAAAAVLIAAWPTHPVLAAAMIAVVFALVAALAWLLIRGQTH